jgi:hypothetical protein
MPGSCAEQRSWWDDYPAGSPSAAVQLDWLQAVAQAHARFVTDLGSMYANAIRSSLPG